MEDDIKVGDWVECINNDNVKSGLGFKEGLCFIVECITRYDDGDVVYFGGLDGHGVYEPYLKKIGRGKFKLQRK